MTIKIEITEDEPTKHANTSGKWPMGYATCEDTCRAGEHLQHVYQALFQWRTDTCKQDYPHSCFTSVALLSHGPLTTIASNHQLNTLNNL